MKRIDPIFGKGPAALLAGLALVLLVGCASSATPNKKIYDRYAVLVAERNRALNNPTAPSNPPAPVQTPVSHSEVQTPPSATDRSPKASPTEVKRSPAQSVAVAAKPVPPPAPPVQVISPKPTPEPPAPPAAVQPALPAQPVPVQPKPELPAPPVTPAAAPSAPAPVPSPAATENPASDLTLATDSVAYVLKPADGVQIFLRGIPSGEAIEGFIDEHGMISMPFINEVKAAGQTPSELARNIRQAYLDQGIYKNISVNVVVPTHYYFIQGEIRAPGRFQIVSTMRVSQAIAAAGGYTEYASGQVVVKRGGKIIKTIRNARRLERTPEDDILLEPDDIIEVKRSLW